ncbi:MAG: DUF4783 domain-containing protein [Sphingobacteriales bacterium]|nr:MAG: DUF4783 domain-containing protein [Sphingobacteriales bacterium]
MRKLSAIFLFLLCFIPAIAQGPVDDMSTSLAAGSLPGISRYFDRSVTMTIAGSQSTYSRSQAEMILKDFFNRNVPRSFQMEHSGKSRYLQYAIGTLHTASGNYRAYFSLKLKDGVFLLQELRIEK